MDDMVDDSGELVAVRLTNPSGVTRLVQNPTGFTIPLRHLPEGTCQTIQGQEYCNPGGVTRAEFMPSIEELGRILNDEPGPDNSVNNLPLVTIESTTPYATEGSDAIFKLARTGETTEALTVPVSTTETGSMLADSSPTSATFAAGDSETEVRIETLDDDADEDDSTVTVTLQSGDTWRLGTNSTSEARIGVLDDDTASPSEATAGNAGQKVWSADMSVTDYGNGNIGAGSASLLANQRGSEGLQARWLYYESGQRRLRIAFTTSVDTAGLRVKAASLDQPFPEAQSGESSFTLENVDVDWSDGDAFEAYLVRGEVAATAPPDPTLKALAVSGATLSPAFDAATTLYTAIVDSATTSATLTATPNDDDATVAFGPAEDADSEAANHQVTVGEGDTLTTVTVTPPGGDVTRTYRVIIKRAGAITVSFGAASYTATEDNAAAQVVVNLDADPPQDVTIPLTATPGGGATTDDYTAPGSVTFTNGGELSQTVAVTATSDETAESGETVTIGFGTLPDQVKTAFKATTTVILADAPLTNNAPSGAPEITGTEQVGSTLAATTSTITDDDGIQDATFKYQWIATDNAADADIDGATDSAYTLVAADAGKTIKVRVTFTDDKGTEETLTSAATQSIAATVPEAPGNLAAAVVAGRQGDIAVSWTAPASDGGAPTSGYKVQWKSGTETYDSSETSTRQAVISDPAVLTHTITALAVDTTYRLRVMASNTKGDGAAAEIVTTAKDRTAPTLASTSINGAALVLTYDKTLDTRSKPSTSAFAVSVGGASRTVTAVSVSGSTVTLTLTSAVTSTDTVTAGYTVPSDADAARIKDTSGNAATGFTGQAVSNDTPRVNTAPSGLPEISGTPQVGHVLTASVDKISDADGLDNTTFLYQWLANDGTRSGDYTAIPNATAATYELTQPQLGKNLKVQVTFTDDAGTEETLVSAATKATTAPLTARFEGMPSEHDGSEFRFELHFSENVNTGYRKVRDRAFSLGEADIKKAQRKNPKAANKNQSWTITVKPDGNEAVSITLPEAASCTDNRSICTYDDRKLSHSTTATVQGPPALSVADASADENSDPALDFVVTLDRASTSTVTVDYATSDGTATAGQDYTASNGTLTFAPGDTVKTVSVTVLNDAHDDGGETLTLTLSNPSGAWIEDGEATGTIENRDPLPTAWTARFGRSVASHVLDALEERLDGSSRSYVQLGGHQLGGSPDVREAVERLAPDNNLSLWEEASADSASRTMTVKELLLGSAFNLVSNDGEDGIGPRLSAWGRVATSGFDGQEDKLSLNGTVTTATLGVDGVWEHWLTGVALAYSEGDGSFTHAETPGGELASSLTSVHPYVAYALSDRVRLWGMVGYGSGSLQLKLAEQDALDTDLAMTMGALGVRGSLLEPSQENGLALACVPTCCGCAWTARRSRAWRRRRRR